VEASEKSGKAQLAREIEIALPMELSRNEQISLVRAYVRDTFVSAGMCADFAVHDKGDGNPHIEMEVISWQKSI
jgi:ATP-dependent exoDNAse (exonuclease V) alpha subunit